MVSGNSTPNHLGYITLEKVLYQNFSDSTFRKVCSVTQQNRRFVSVLEVILMSLRWLSENYRKFPKYSDTQNICCNHSKIWTTWLYHRVMGPNDADGIANSVDPDQTASVGAVWSGSALFVQAYLSENLGSLR